MFDRGRGVKCNGTGITGSGDFIRFKGLYAERRKNSTSGYSGSRYIGGCERVIDSGAAERMIAISKCLKEDGRDNGSPAILFVNILDRWIGFIIYITKPEWKPTLNPCM